MKIEHYKETPPDEVGEVGASGLTVRWVISEKDGAPNFSMRVFEVAPGGYSPYHSHPWEHEVFILTGNGVVVQEGDTVPLFRGDVLFIPPGETHQLKNNSDETLEFICLIPNPE
jgi:quercetin dioxygenase-like cupin family protein